MDIQQDLLAALGDVWTLHTAPSGGGLLAGWTLTVSIADRAKADEVDRKLREFLKQMAGMRAVEPLVRTFQIGEQQAYTFQFPDNDVFVAPSWCLTETHLVVTLLPQTLKSFVARQGQPSLATIPEVAQMLEQQVGPCTLLYQDTRSQFVTFYPLVQIGAQVVARQLNQEGIAFDSISLPSIDAVAPHLLPLVSVSRKVSNGFESYTYTSLPGSNLGASAPVMVAMLLPAVQSAREAARRVASMNNMKQIGLALHNYHDVYNSFPARASVDKDGKRLLSWRVYVLPFIEETALYDKFHLDEAWDSPHNRGLIAQMPKVYLSPNSVAEPGKTVYLGNASKSGIFSDAAKKDDPRQSVTSGTRINRILDGTSNTIMLVEADDAAAVVWTKPDDLEFDPEKAIQAQGLGGMRPGGFLALFADGSVRFISAFVDQNILARYLPGTVARPSAGSKHPRTKNIQFCMSRLPCS